MFWPFASSIAAAVPVPPLAAPLALGDAMWAESRWSRRSWRVAMMLADGTRQIVALQTGCCRAWPLRSQHTRAVSMLVGLLLGSARPDCLPATCHAKITEAISSYVVVRYYI